MFGERISFSQTNRNLKVLFFMKILFSILCLLVFNSFVFGQNLKEFKEIWINESREYLLNQQKPLPYLQSGFHHFSRLQDDEFTVLLENGWEKFPAVPATHVPKSRKFDPGPQFVLDETSYHNPQYLPFFTAEKSEEASGIACANLPGIRKPEYASSSPLKQSFKFYGNTIAVSYDRLLSLPVNQPVNNEIIVEYWKKFMVGNSNHLIRQLMTYRDRLGLNDWGYFLLVKSCSSSLYPEEEAAADLLAWALMIRSGYDVKIGYNQLGVSVLYPAASKINGIPHIRIDGTDYYIDRPISSFPITSNVQSHAGASGTIHLRINRSLNFRGEAETKKIQFLWDRKLHTFNLKFNPEVIRFMEDYPQTDPELYFGAPFTVLAMESLVRQMKPVLAGMKQEEGAAFLQQFVQKSFAYHPFNDNYGYDRFMFPEELLFKDESNDKGKALLYAWFVSNLLNQKAALIEFPGFYSVAVSLDQPMDGDNFIVGGRSYTMADPTFENAPLGLVMNEFYPLKPVIRILNNRSSDISEQDKIWKLALAFGAERSGSGKDFLRDESGNSYITGFFIDKNKSQPSSVPAPFIAKYDENNSLAWMVKFKAGGRSFGLELKQLDKNEFYLAGSFRGKLECSGLSLLTANTGPDLFFVQFNKLGEIEWMSKSGLDELEEDIKLFYIVRFTRAGDIQSVSLSNEDERTGITGFHQSTNEGLCYVASRYQTTGLDKSNEEASLKSTALFRQNLKQMKQLGIEQTTACLSAVFHSVISTGNQLTGADLLSFKQLKTDSAFNSLSYLTEILQKISLIKNNNGIIEIYTANGIPLRISSFKIHNHSHLKIIPLDNNDLKIRIIDGVEFESGSLREKINSFIIELSTGNIILDLGMGNQILTRNLKQTLTPY